MDIIRYYLLPSSTISKIKFQFEIVLQKFKLWCILIFKQQHIIIISSETILNQNVYNYLLTNSAALKLLNQKYEYVAIYLILVSQFSRVQSAGRGYRIHQLHLWRGVRPHTTTVLDWMLNTLMARGNVEHPFIAIVPRSTLTRSGSSWLGITYGSNRTD